LIGIEACPAPVTTLLLLLVWPAHFDVY